jgi:transglutaminase-like putative cysteine protease
MLESSTPGRWWDAPAALLLLAALLTTASRLVVTEWTDHLSIVHTLTLLGALSGLALGQSAFSSRRVSVFALPYGVFAISWQLGLTLTRISGDALWSDRSYNMVIRLVHSFAQLARQEPVQDPLLFVCSMAVLAWGMGVHAGYTLTRHAHPWRAVLPAGLAQLIIQTYDPFLSVRAWYMVIYLFFALLLVARVTYLRHRARWQREHVFLPTYVGVDLGRVTVQVAALLVLAAWTTPALATAFSPAQSAWRDVSRPWLSIRDRLEDAMASLRDQFGGVYSVYGDSLLLGRGNELTDDIAMVVEVQPDAPTPVRYYWRARVYDHYANGQWNSTIVSATQRVTPEDFELILPAPEQSTPGEGDWTAAFTITTAGPISTLFIPARPVWLDHSARADLTYNPDGAVEIVALHANPPLYAGEVYQVHSAFSDVTIAQLRSAGVAYPEWITSHYLQLPDDISPRIRELARQITFELDNPYDIASAITLYLRTYIQYTEVIPSHPSAGQEPLEWFLFDVREGYCSYYASAEVIMLRLLGIPARMAVGYAEGAGESGSEIYMISQRGTNMWPEGSELYVVRHRDAHAWPEVYFPGVGWVEFEPTASQPPLYRPLGEDPADATEDALSLFDLDPEQRERWEEYLEGLELPADGSLPESPPDTPASGLTVAIVALTVSLGLSLILLAVVWRKHRPRTLTPVPVLLKRGLDRFDIQPPAALARWVLHATLPPLARAYQELNYALIRLGAPPDPAATPAERAAALSRLLPEAAGSAGRLLAEYHDMAYSLRPGDPDTAQQAGRDVRTLSWRAVIQKRLARLRA